MQLVPCKFNHDVPYPLVTPFHYTGHALALLVVSFGEPRNGSHLLIWLLSHTTKKRQQEQEEETGGDDLMTTAATGFGSDESMTPRGDAAAAAAGASAAEFAPVTPGGSGSEPGTPPSTRRGKTAGLSAAFDLLAPLERSAASASAHSNILSPRYDHRAAAIGARGEDDEDGEGLTDDRDEIGTPKTPEGEESAMAYHNGGTQSAGSGGGFNLPQLSPPQPSNQRQLHNLAVPSPGSTHSKSGPANHFRRSHTYVKQLSRESARELAKTALSLRATSIGEFTFDARESTVRENIRRVQVCFQAAP